MKRTAFTLLELLLVLAIIATICGLGITSYQRQYARAQFKSGVVQIQVDLHKTRLLAMQSGEAYLFRYVPGTSVYEIAPLKTLQEVLYRIHGEAEDSSDDALGGSLSLNASSVSGFPSEITYSDDLFSVENIEADVVAMNRRLNESKQATQSVDSLGLGGNLTSIPNETADDLSFSNFGTLNDDLFSTSGVALGNENFSTGTTSLDASAISMNFRELNAYEKSLAKDNSIACRVNNDGVIVRKQTTGDVVFTILRVSQSTPSNLRTRRPQGLSTDVSVMGESDFDFASEKALGGSLTSIPDGSETSDNLGGGLNGISGETSVMSGVGELSKEDQARSFWSEPIVFYPNGKTSSAVLGLESAGDYAYYSEIALRGMTGVARISSISAVPPGAEPNSSVLTQEQLFRLSNPLQNDDKSQNVGLASSGALGGSVNVPSNGATANISSSFDDFNELNASTDDIFSEEQQTPNINYGTDRRSGYNFNGNVSSSTNTATLGVSLDQNSLSTLNESVEEANSNTLDAETVGPKQFGANENYSTLNGGSL